MSGAIHARSVINRFSEKRAVRPRLPGNGPTFPPCALGAGEAYHLTGPASRGLVSSQHVMTADPHFLAISPSPVSRLPDVIRAAVPIARTSIIGPISDGNCH